jgi:hypothetical protein
MTAILEEVEDAKSIMKLQPTGLVQYGVMSEIIKKLKELTLGLIETCLTTISTCYPIKKLFAPMPTNFPYHL